MNRKINSVLAIVVVVLIAGTAWAVFDSRNKQEGKKPAPAAPSVGSKSAQSQPSKLADVALITKDNGDFEINLATKELKPYSDPNGAFLSLAGLPKESGTVVNSVAIASQDKTQALVVSVTLDKAADENSENSPNILKADEFICKTASKSCEKSEILAAAYKAAGKTGKWFDDQSIEWVGFDSAKNVVFGYVSGEDGRIYSAYSYDVIGKSIAETSGKTAGVPVGAFSPSLGKFVAVDYLSDKWDLLLYDSGNLKAPLKKIDISKMIDLEDEENSVGSIAWSGDEKNIVLATDNQISMLNLDSGAITPEYTDMVDEAVNEDEEVGGIDSSAIVLSSSGRYVAFVDYDRGDLPYDENKSYTVLKVIDIVIGGEPKELLREEGISLSVQ